VYLFIKFSALDFATAGTFCSTPLSKEATSSQHSDAKNEFILIVLYEIQMSGVERKSGLTSYIN
jgi:hypothetical protein